MFEMPAWWWELLEILGVSNVQELAQKIRASFKLPQWMSEILDVDNYYLSPLAPRCIWQKAFLLPLDPKFLCWDIREGQLKKTIAYAQAPQYWVEKANPLMPGQPCLLARCILELRKARESYVSFPDDAASPEGSLEDVNGVTIPGAPCQLLPVLPPKKNPWKDQHLWRLPLRKLPPPRSPLRDWLICW